MYTKSLNWVKLYNCGIHSRSQNWFMISFFHFFFFNYFNFRTIKHKKLIYSQLLLENIQINSPTIYSTADEIRIVNCLFYEINSTAITYLDPSMDGGLFISHSLFYSVNSAIDATTCEINSTCFQYIYGQYCFIIYNETSLEQISINSCNFSCFQTANEFSLLLYKPSEVNVMNISHNTCNNNYFWYLHSISAKNIHIQNLIANNGLYFFVTMNQSTIDDSNFLNNYFHDYFIQGGQILITNSVFSNSSNSSIASSFVCQDCIGVGDNTQDYSDLAINITFQSKNMCHPNYFDINNSMKLIRPIDSEELCQANEGNCLYCATYDDIVLSKRRGCIVCQNGYHVEFQSNDIIINEEGENIYYFGICVKDSILEVVKVEDGISTEHGCNIEGCSYCLKRSVNESFIEYGCVVCNQGFSIVNTYDQNETFSICHDFRSTNPFTFNFHSKYKQISIVKIGLFSYFIQMPD
ncbi:hypothetical protein TRFO_09661 [Tritrichomonas foetus]|uniref:Uncharacterized protein n=1 Tax=Tritrichomonas foetus TaxID=1144522 RepID=A0A1J4JEL3_9EUKA|nr:hypothetical protein TRFO_09661 [Tritrichomonas foetus]|eukprot:OHS97097.1 hypothetical protein TRFO_09661 [Tritrichomonas foetus]